MITSVDRISSSKNQARSSDIVELLLTKQFFVSFVKSVLVLVSESPSVAESEGVS